MKTNRTRQWISGIAATVIFAACLCGCKPSDSTSPAARVSAFVAGNSPYYQKMEKMAAGSGLTVRKSFNNAYDTILPQARGHVLLVETYDGKPIVPMETLEKYFPGAGKGLRQSDGIARLDDTILVFVNCSKPLQNLKLSDKDLKRVADRGSPANGDQPTR